jgi:hypothetical protein
VVSLRGLVCAAMLLPLALRGQASPYVPIDDIAYTYVDALMARGSLEELATLERPYTVNAIRAAADTALERDPTPRLAGYLRALERSLERHELRKRIEPASDSLPFRAKATFDVYVTAETSARQELMLADASNDAEPGMAGYFVLGGGNLVAAVRAILDTRLNRDPDFTGKKDRKIAGRTQDGYVGGQWKYAEVAFGRVARNWGPPALHGLQLSGASFTYDHLYSRFGTERIHISSVIARLENYVITPGVETSRYFSVHRLAYRHGRFEGALSEGFLYTGVGRGLEPVVINPFNVYSLSWRNERVDGNLSMGFEGSWRAGRFGTYAAHLMLDDLQIDECDSACSEPNSYALTATAEGLPLFGEEKWFASYTRVSNLSYRTPNFAERYASYGIGLGRAYSDYDEVRVGADLSLVPRTPLKLYVARRRQGEGDYRESYPAVADYAITPVFLSGVVWTVNRIGLSGASIVSRDLQLTGDLGVNHVSNRRNILGKDITAFEGRLKVIWVPRWLITFQ